MEQKKNQKDVLIVRDEKTGEISVVAGLKKDGTPKTTAASGANQKDFLLFDKNSNPLDSFLDNFLNVVPGPFSSVSYIRFFGLFFFRKPMLFN